MKLRATLKTTNVMLDVPGTSFVEVVDHVLNLLLAAGELKLELLPRIRAIFLALESTSPGRDATESFATQPDSPLDPSALSSPGPPSPNVLPQSIGARVSTASPARDSSRPRVALATKASASHDALPSLPPLAISAAPPPPRPPEAPAPPVSPMGAAAAVAEAHDWYAMLTPNADEEALDLLLAHVTFVDSPLMAFVRCTQPIDASCELHTPVRYLFLLVGPEADMAVSAQIAHALAGIMLDEPFVAAVADAADATDVLAALDERLEAITILPHVHVRHVHNPPGPPPGGDRGQHPPGAVPPSRSATPTALHTTSVSSDMHSSDEAGCGESEEDEDEDEVVFADLEDHLRLTQALPQREPISHRAHYKSFGGGNASTHGGMHRRPSFADLLNTEAER